MVNHLVNHLVKCVQRALSAVEDLDQGIVQLAIYNSFIFLLFLVGIYQEHYKA